MSEQSASAMKPGDYFILLPCDGGNVMVDPAAVVAVSQSAAVGHSMLFIAGGALEVRMSLAECCAIIAKGAGKQIVSPARKGVVS